MNELEIVEQFISKLQQISGNKSRCVLSLSQYALSYPPDYKGKDYHKDIDWDFLDDKREEFKNKPELYSVDSHHRFKLFRDYSVGLYEDYYLYRQCYPNSKSNPWTDIIKLLDTHLIYISDEGEIELLAFRKPMWQFSAWESNEDYNNGEPPFLTREYDDHTAMKVFSGAHSYDNRKKYPDYVSDYDKFYV